MTGGVPVLSLSISPPDPLGALAPSPTLTGTYSGSFQRGGGGRAGRQSGRPCIKG